MLSRIPLCGLLLWVWSCSATSESDPFGPSGAGGGGAGGGGPIDTGGPFSDFPDPLVDPLAPPNSADLFGDPENGAPGGGPCLVEAEPGTLYPRNWLRPRFTWIGGGMNLFELRLRVENQTKDLVVYTVGSSWTMPKPMWDALRQHSAGVMMTVSIRGGTFTGQTLEGIALGSSGPMQIAPVDAPGSIVFWSIDSAGGEVSQLKGFGVGEEGVVDVLKAEQLPQYGAGGRNCIGCHTGSPDGKFVSFTWEVNGGEGYNIDLASVDKASAPGPQPNFLGAQAKIELAAVNRTLTTFSKSHWSPGDRVLVTEKDDHLMWIDLEANAPPASGVLGRDGDPNARGFGPSFSNDGQSLVYMSGASALGQTPFDWAGPLDLYVMPYNNRAGATGGALAQPLAGASDPNVTEYYPAYSPDDQWIAYTAIGGAGSIYDNPNAEVFVVPRAGGQSIRMEANAPPACGGQTTPGITNSWPKWSPEVSSANGRKYYWLVFSSRRASAAPKLYVAPMTVEPDGSAMTYKALYFWNQELIPAWDQWGNHTPAWANFTIPSVIE
jgi:hypothetical protein